MLLIKPLQGVEVPPPHTPELGFHHLALVTELKVGYGGGGGGAVWTRMMQERMISHALSVPKVWDSGEGTSYSKVGKGYFSPSLQPF